MAQITPNTRTWWYIPMAERLRKKWVQLSPHLPFVAYINGFNVHEETELLWDSFSKRKCRLSTKLSLGFVRSRSQDSEPLHALTARQCLSDLQWVPQIHHGTKDPIKMRRAKLDLRLQWVKAHVDTTGLKLQVKRQRKPRSLAKSQI